MTLTSTLRNTLFYGTLTAATAFGFASQAYADGPARNSVVTFTPQEVEECRKNTKCREDILGEKDGTPPPQSTTAQTKELPPTASPLPGPAPLAVEKKEEGKDNVIDLPADHLEGAPGYTLRARLVPKNLSAETAAREDKKGEDKKESKSDSSALETLVSTLRQQVQTLQEQLQNYLSSRSASLGISEGFEQIDGNYGLFTAVDLALQLEDWIALRTEAEVSYATTALSRTNTQADQGRTSLEQHLVERWSYSRTDSESYRNALAFSAAVLLGSLDRDTFGVKDLDAYLALGGKVRLVEGIQERTEQRTSQLLYRGEPRDKLQSPAQVTADSTLLPLLIPTAGIGVCYGVFDSADICAEFGTGLRVENPDKPGEARLETEGSVGIKFGF